MYRYVYLNSDSTVGHFDEQYLGKNLLALEGYYFGSIPTKFLQYIDDKMDDGDAKLEKFYLYLWTILLITKRFMKMMNIMVAQVMRMLLIKRVFVEKVVLCLMYNSVGFIYYYLF